MTTTITINGTPALALTEELAEVIRYAGQEPSDFNVMRWPVGAGRYGSVRLVVADTAIDPASIYEIDFGGIIFDRMTPLPPRPIMASDGSGVLYDYTFVDERYRWQRIAYDEVGFNISTDDRSGVFAASGKIVEPDGAIQPVSIRHAIEKLFCSLEGQGAATPQELRFFDPHGEGQLAYDGWRDVTAGGLPVGPTIDRVLAMAGYVLVARPNTTLEVPADPVTPQSESGCFVPADKPAWRYSLWPIASGRGATLANAIRTYASDIIGGGVVWCDAVDPFEDLIDAPLETILPDVPSKVVVRFPLVSSDADYTRNDIDGDEAGISWQVDRYHVVESDAGKPTGSTTVPTPSVSVVDSTWAIAAADGTITNAAQLADRAASVALYYYDRYRSGAGDLLFRGILPIVTGPGSTVTEWRAGLRGPMTRICGDVHDPIFGWTNDEAVRPSSIMSTGWIRAIPRPGGGILLDVPPEATLRRLYYATVTAVSAPFNASYDAEAIGFPGVTVENTPPLRPWDTSLVDVEAVAVGDPCLIGEREDGSLDLYVLQERPTLTTCEGAVQAASQNDAVAFGAHGV